ncbi:hypothetical protein KKG31_00170 [Patescibacteria group bacterium]|nr:hypothetical protein [Patescibacteria group bacterium]MBU1757606.1 hypothetical protein [Patescibacteria group bacterium]
MEVSDLFAEFESVIGDEALDVSQQTKRKEALQKIVTRISSSVALE